MKTCQNPNHSELDPQVAKFVLDRQAWATWLKSEPRFLCEACAWVWEHLNHLDRDHYSLDEIEEWVSEFEGDDFGDFIEFVSPAELTGFERITGYEAITFPELDPVPDDEEEE